MSESTAESPTGVGMSEQEQTPPLSTVARERMALLINNNTIVIEDCRKINALLDADPTLDSTLCRLFGMKAKSDLEVYRR